MQVLRTLYGLYGVCTMYFVYVQVIPEGSAVFLV